MNEAGMTSMAQYEWDTTANKWVKKTIQTELTGLTNVSISGVTPVAGKLPVDASLSVGEITIASIPLTQVYPSGIFAQIERADDLITKVQYYESDAIFGVNATISGITYSSASLGTTITETFTSGTNFFTITRAI
jgi:hypothetical protein